MTCICGHHEKAHLSDIGLCAAPEGCNCNHFRKLAPNPEPFVDAAKATQDAEWLAGSEADTAERNLARCYLALTQRPVDILSDEWWATETEAKQ